MLTYHLVVLLIRAGDVVQAVLEAGCLTNSAGTTDWCSTTETEQKTFCRCRVSY